MSLKVGNFLFRLVQLKICFSGSPIHRPILFSTTKCCAGAHFSPQCCVYEALHNYDNYCTACSWQCLVLVLYAKWRMVLIIVTHCSAKLLHGSWYYKLCYCGCMVLLSYCMYYILFKCGCMVLHGTAWATGSAWQWFDMLSEAGCQQLPPPIASSRTTQLPASSHSNTLVRFVSNTLVGFVCVCVFKCVLISSNCLESTQPTPSSHSNTLPPQCVFTCVLSWTTSYCLIALHCGYHLILESTTQLPAPARIPTPCLDLFGFSPLCVFSNVSSIASDCTQHPAGSHSNTWDHFRTHSRKTKQESDQFLLILGQTFKWGQKLWWKYSTAQLKQKLNHVGDIFIVSKYIVFLKVISQRFLTRLPTTFYNWVLLRKNLWKDGEFR